MGGIITSPIIPLGKTGIILNYQGSIQNINADTDRQEFLDPGENEDRTNLTRYQVAASLNKGFSLWQGQPPTSYSRTRIALHSCSYSTLSALEYWSYGS